MCHRLLFCLLSKRTFSKQRIYFAESGERFSGVIIFSISRELGNTWSLKRKGWIPRSKYLVRCLVAVRLSAPHVISVVSDSAMSNVLGRIEATSPTITAGTPTKLKHHVISLVHANNGLVQHSLTWRGLCSVKLIWPKVLVCNSLRTSPAKLVQTRKVKEIVRPARDVTQESHRKARVDAVMRLFHLFFFF